MKITDDAVFRRFWYPVMAQSRVGNRPHAVSLFFQDMVLWQGTGGVVSALEDRCGHEGARLSPGDVCGDRLVCPHHHWEFAVDGRCVHIPQRPGLIPGPRAHVRPYFAVGRFGLAWVAVEQPLAPIPEVPELEEPGFRVIHTMHERWRVSAFRFAEAALDIAACLGTAEANVVAVEEEPFGCSIHFRLPAGDGLITGSITWFAPTTRVLRLSYPSGLRRVLVAAAAPLADRWITVSRVEARDDAETDMLAADVIARDREIARAERERLQAMPPDVPVLPAENEEGLRGDPGYLSREALRRIVATHGMGT